MKTIWNVSTAPLILSHSRAIDFKSHQDNADISPIQLLIVADYKLSIWFNNNSFVLLSFPSV